jgi:hypothetical protein
MARRLDRQGLLSRAGTAPFIGDISNAHYSLAKTPEGALEETRRTMKDIAVIMLLNEDAEVQARFLQLAEYRV